VWGSNHLQDQQLNQLDDENYPEDRPKPADSFESPCFLDINASQSPMPCPPVHVSTLKELKNDDPTSPATVRELIKQAADLTAQTVAVNTVTNDDKNNENEGKEESRKASMIAIPGARKRTLNMTNPADLDHLVRRMMEEKRAGEERKQEQQQQKLALALAMATGTDVNVNVNVNVDEVAQAGDGVGAIGLQVTDWRIQDFSLVRLLGQLLVFCGRICDETDRLINGFENFLSTTGSGAYATVYLAHHDPTSKLYALKVLNKLASIQTHEVSHVMSEKAVLSSLPAHPGTVTL
jgi:hypothetical protein